MRTPVYNFGGLTKSIKEKYKGPKKFRTTMPPGSRHIPKFRPPKTIYTRPHRQNSPDPPVQRNEYQESREPLLRAPEQTPAQYYDPRPEPRYHQRPVQRNEAVPNHYAIPPASPAAPINNNIYNNMPAQQAPAPQPVQQLQTKRFNFFGLATTIIVMSICVVVGYWLIKDPESLITHAQNIWHQIIGMI